mgnify:CR=1 FL=1
MTKSLAHAIHQRSHLLNDHTNALRLVDAAGDGLPDLFLDTFADTWLVSTRTNYLDREVKSWLIKQEKSCYWKQLDQHEKESPSHIAGPVQNETFIARENGVNYRIDFQAGYSQGIFLVPMPSKKWTKKLTAMVRSIMVN